ncbi:MAG: hypothetical protein J7L34_07245 [Thermotogaceae bacterium]|nr:hypothetical protein [Thermotogaceae bacterium]
MARPKASKLLKAFLIAIILGTLFIAFHYLYFESTRLSTCGVDIFNDWRSYVASVMQKIPFVKQRVKYTPLNIGDPNYYYKSVISSYAEEINAKMEELDKKEANLEKMKKQLEIEIRVLKELQEKWREFYEKEELSKKVYQDVEDNLKKLSSLMGESDAESIAKIINQESISVRTIAAALQYLPSDVSAEIVQALGKINPEKAAEVMKHIDSIDQDLENIKAEKEELKKALEELIQEKQKLLEIEGFSEVIANYINDMSVEQLGALIEDLGLGVEEVIKMVNLMESVKRQKFLNYLRENNPSIFMEIFKRGIGG